jgi:hypothetical protein
MPELEYLPIIRSEVAFHLADRPGVLDELRAKARQLDLDEAGILEEDLPTEYTAEQALQVVFHHAPDFLFGRPYEARILDGWVFERNVWEVPV